MPSEIGHVSADKDASDRDSVLDLAVVRSLARLTGGEIEAFERCSEPPDEIVRWLATAAAPDVNGMLIQTVRRWHELRQVRDA